MADRLLEALGRNILLQRRLTRALAGLQDISNIENESAGLAVDIAENTLADIDAMVTLDQQKLNLMGDEFWKEILQ